MKKRNTTRMLGFFIPLFWILFCLLPGGAWAQYPIMTPPDGATGVPINIRISIQFDTTMTSGNISVEDNELDNELEGTGTPI